MALAAALPSQTLHVSNLEGRIKKHAMKRALFYLFSTYGPVIDIVIKRTAQMREQAFVVFADMGDATLAMRSLQAAVVFSKPLRIQYAKKKSRAVLVQQEGSANWTASLTGAAPANPLKRRHDVDSDSDDASDSEDEASAKRPRTGEEVPPSKVLFLTSLPTSATHEQLRGLFAGHAGFMDVRMVPGRTGIAFVDFEDADRAARARNIVDGFEIEKGHKITAVFAKQ